MAKMSAVEKRLTDQMMALALEVARCESNALDASRRLEVAKARVSALQDAIDTVRAQKRVRAKKPKPVEKV